ncbi:MAG: Lrp/AsnC family transcriptional regulator [Nanoarchaeota archaeon]|nr:Lrp/AsnC family transcriptional regulator [Nanoarchaeota archaeon]
MEKVVKLDLYDKKLLYELDKKSNIGLNELAKKLRKSKQFVLYRIKRLEDENVITSYTAIVDMSKLGYFTFRVYLKLQHMTEDDKKEMIEFVKNNKKQVWTITAMHGKWDIALFLGVRTIMEFHQIWEDVMLRYKKNIPMYNVSIYAPIFNFNRRFFFDAAEEPLMRIYGDGSKEDYDELDWKIIQLYATNVRQSSLEIAKKLGITADTVRSRIKKLEAKKILCGYKIGINLDKLGYTSYRVDLQLSSSAKDKSLFEFCRMHKNIYQINKSIGGSDFELEVIVKDLNELIQIIDEIRTKFKDVVNDVDYFAFSTFHVLQFIPD